MEHLGIGIQEMKGGSSWFPKKLMPLNSSPPRKSQTIVCFLHRNHHISIVFPGKGIQKLHMFNINPFSMLVLDGFVGSDHAFVSSQTYHLNLDSAQD